MACSVLIRCVQTKLIDVASITKKKWSSNKSLSHCTECGPDNIVFAHIELLLAVQSLQTVL